MSSDRNIVIVGASFAGLQVSHYLLKHTFPELKKASASQKYKLHLIDPSSRFYWKIGAPRASVSTSLLPHSSSFLPIADGFKQYPSDSFEIHQGEATAVNTEKKTITIKSTQSGSEETLLYHQLVIATGTRTASPASSLHGDWTLSRNALDTMNSRLSSGSIKNVVVVGGGPVGVETAGEIGEALNGTAGWFASRPSENQTKAKVTLLTGSSKLLPVLRQGISDKAEKFLNRVGVDVVYNSRVENVELSEADAQLIDLKDSEKGSNPQMTVLPTEQKQTKVHLKNGQTLTTDLYVAASGVVPNSEFLPSNLLDTKGFVNTDSHLRVVDNVYCVGDAGNYSRGGALAMKDAIPVIVVNMSNDLLQEVGGSIKSTREYKEDPKEESQVVPIGRNKGVGAFKGNQVPSLMVWALKGRDYMSRNAPGIVQGKDQVKAVA